jgi:lipopolysaccharide heptosyltransferase I
VKILISRMSAMGDVICTMGAAGSLRQGLPEAEIHWAVDPRFAPLVERCRHVDRVIPLRPKPAELRRFWREAEPYDAALDLQGLLKSALVIAGVKAGRKLGYHWQREGARLFSSPVMPDPSSHHVVDQYIDVARELGGADGPTDFGLTPTEQDLAAARELMPSGDAPWVIFNAGAGWAAKRWSPAQYAALANALSADGAVCAFIGAKDGLEAMAEVKAAGAHQVVDLIGKTSLGSLTGLISLAALHVGGDTGSTHMAAALGRPAIGLFTQTRPERCCPYGQFSHCATLDPDEVTAMARGILGSIRAR